MLGDPFIVGVLLLVTVLGIGGSWFATRRLIRSSRNPWIARIMAVVGGCVFALVSLPFVSYADYLGTVWGSSFGPAGVIACATSMVGACIALFLLTGALAGSVLGRTIGVIIARFRRSA